MKILFLTGKSPLTKAMHTPVVPNPGRTLFISCRPSKSARVISLKNIALWSLKRPDFAGGSIKTSPAFLTNSTLVFATITNTVLPKTRGAGNHHGTLVIGSFYFCRIVPSACSGSFSPGSLIYLTGNPG